MTEIRSHVIGILGYGSLIDNPGKEISEIEVERINCITPFNVEFARTSATRGNAPTLIPVAEGGRKVNAVIIILKPDISIRIAESILWRRELHKKNRNETYLHSDTASLNKVVIKSLPDFMNVQTVIYTSIGCNIADKLTSQLLADLSIDSILSEAGQQEKDGLRYLLAAKRNGIVTKLSEEYENQILLKTGTKSLEQAIETFDRKRKMYLAGQ